MNSEVQLHVESKTDNLFRGWRKSGLGDGCLKASGQNFIGLSASQSLNGNGYLIVHMAKVGAGIADHIPKAPETTCRSFPRSRGIREEASPILFRIKSVTEINNLQHKGNPPD